MGVLEDRGAIFAPGSVISRLEGSGGVRGVERSEVCWGEGELRSEERGRRGEWRNDGGRRREESGRGEDKKDVIKEGRVAW